MLSSSAVRPVLHTPMLKTSHLDGLAPEGLMGDGVPQVNLSVLGAGDKLLHGGMDVQTPQLIRVTLKRILFTKPDTDLGFQTKLCASPKPETCKFCVCVCVCIPAQ